MDHNELLNLSTDMGYELLRSGAETYRVEETVYRFVIAYPVRYINVFAVPTCIMVSITLPDGETITKNRRVHTRAVDLDRVDLINSLCRKTCAEAAPLEQVRREFARITAAKPYPLPMRVLGFMLIAFSFTLFFGGTVRDALCALYLGVAAQLTVYVMERWEANGVFVNIIASGLTAVLAILSVDAGLAQNVDKMIIGTFMTLVPGVALTNAMRDIMAGDYLAGQARLTEALLTAAALALGAGAALTVARML